MSANECMEQFSPHLFWDVRKEDIDLDAHAQYVIQRVLEYGLLGDWNLIKSYYGLPKIVETAKGLRSLEPVRWHTLPLFQKPLKNSSDAIPGNS